jgi:hypothetical protein
MDRRGRKTFAHPLVRILQHDIAWCEIGGNHQTQRTPRGGAQAEIKFSQLTADESARNGIGDFQHVKSPKRIGTRFGHVGVARRPGRIPYWSKERIIPTKWRPSRSVTSTRSAHMDSGER